MAEFGVGFKLFADSSQFQRELKEATESAKNVQRGLKDIGLNIGGLLGIGAVTNAFLSTVNAAQQLRDEAEKVGRAVDSSVQSVANLGDSLDLLKNGARDFSINTLGVFTKLGEALGNFALRLGEGLTQAQIDNNAKISSDAEKNIAKMAAARENYATKLAEADEKLAKAQRENAIKRAGDEDKLNALLGEQMRIQEEINKTGKNTVKARELQIESENNITAIVAERDRIAKKAIEDEAKALKEREKDEKELAKAQSEFAERKQKSAEKLADLRFKALSDEEKVNALAKEELELREAVAALKASGVDSTEVEVMLIDKQNQLIEQQNALREKKLIVQKKNRTEEENFLLAVKLGAQEAQKAFNDVITAQFNLRRSSGAIEGASDAELKEFIKRTRERIAAIDSAAMSGAEQVSGGFGRKFEKIPLTSDLARAVEELKLRESLRTNFQLGGEQFARERFKGDALAFDSLAQRFVSDTRTLQEIQKESTSELKDLNARLSKFGFTK